MTLIKLIYNKLLICEFLIIIRLSWRINLNHSPLSLLNKISIIRNLKKYRLKIAVASHSNARQHKLKIF